ncbi:exodeoxyribonuclease VII, small subunit [Clostridiales bacterium oral taxon 876 str. F0540]|nr:exodeoxyribonuclease VII, small subunit [Clostridiales bacterium oral taxon 876 str. F0540]
MAKKNESFESMMKKLEEIVSSMDNDALTLEQSMKHYEEGIILCNKLYKVIHESEEKIKILTQNREEDFLGSEE